MEIKKKQLICPECQNEIILEKYEYEVGEIISCPFCGSDLEVEDITEDGELLVAVIEEEK